VYYTNSDLPLTSSTALYSDASLPAPPSTVNNAGPQIGNRTAPDDPRNHENTDLDPISSAPRFEVRHFPDTDDSDGEVVVIDGSRPVTDKASRALEEALVDADLERLKELLSSKPALANRSIEVLQCTPLVAAIEMKRADIVDYLLSLPGINLNTCGSSGITPFHAACIGGDVTLAKRLLRSGARVNSCDGCSTPLIAACTLGDASLIRKILKRTNKALVDLRPSGQHTALTAAIEAGQRTAVKLLLCKGADPNLRGPRGMTPLHHAAEHGQLKIAKLLFDFGAVQLSTQSGMPGNLACEGNHASTLALLLKKAPRDQLQGMWLTYATMGAITHDATDCLEVLLATGFDMLSERGGISLLMSVVLLERPQSVAVLLRHGANPNYQTRSGNSPLSAAVDSRSSMDIMLILISAMGPRVTLAHEVALKLVQRAREEKDFRILNELALRQIEDRDGQPFDLLKALNA
jgi:ankyrin repeat protein